MTNKELLDHLEYEARIHSDLHGVNSPSAVKAREALERAKEILKTSPAIERA